ncbi:hypothetical protein J3L16_09740 [Alteromonas sp. 5E99-2]|uniref:hypothetical protein n=1 Tax=Alteromonas sp. 5E99-2 TaxID=2817683 RepID=UPI001A995131|nr:hypothetical protein [Alteromonas sp. 5E99-2]MBO1255965.1 hypothetical protein [Alteromonas sp. 5E99-2]
MPHETTSADLVHAVLEEVSSFLFGGFDAVRSIQTIHDSIDVIGGGAKSVYWLQFWRIPSAFQ